MRAAVLAFVLLLVAGCAPKARTTGTYFPLQEGNVWTYDMVGPHGPQKLEFRVVRVEPGSDGMRYLLDDAGRRYYVKRGESIAISVAPGIWTVLLDGPLRLGKRFDGGVSEGIVPNTVGDPEAKNDPRIRPIPSAGYKVITAFDRKVTVAAGTFERCLEVTHVAGAIVGIKLYAPGVGLVLSESWLERGGKRVKQTRQELTSYQVKE